MNFIGKKENEMKFFLNVIVILLGVFMLISISHAEINPKTIVGYWNFNEGAGKMAADGSGNKLNGDLAGNPKWIDGKIGKALSFNGKEDYVDVPDMVTPEYMTFACWFKKTGPGSGGVPRLHSRGTSPWSIEYGIGNTHQPNQLEFYFAFQDGSTAGWLPFFEPKEGVWYHTAISYDGTWVRAYVDGAEVYSNDQWKGKKINQGISRIGGGALGDAFEGQIDEAILFNIAISENDVKSLMSGKWASVDPIGKSASLWGSIKSKSF